MIRAGLADVREKRDAGEVFLVSGADRFDNVNLAT